MAALIGDVECFNVFPEVKLVNLIRDIYSDNRPLPVVRMQLVRCLPCYMNMDFHVELFCDISNSIH